MIGKVTVGFEPITLRSEVWFSTNWANRGLDVTYYFNDFYVYMYFLYQCKHWYKF